MAELALLCRAPHTQHSAGSEAEIPAMGFLCAVRAVSPQPEVHCANIPRVPEEMFSLESPFPQPGSCSCRWEMKPVSLPPLQTCSGASRVEMLAGNARN